MEDKQMDFYSKDRSQLFFRDWGINICYKL